MTSFVVVVFERYFGSLWQGLVAGGDKVQRFISGMPGRPILLRNQGGGTNYTQSQAANSVAPISVYAVNYPRFRARENKTMALLSALMLMVATSGLFAASSLTWVDFSSLHESMHNSSIQASGWRADSALTWDQFAYYRSWTVGCFCVSAFSYMTACMLSYIFMVRLLNPMTTKDVVHDVGPMLYRMPKVYFIVGYISLVAGMTFYFLCMVDGHATSLCLFACFICMILPTSIALYRAMGIMPDAEVVDA